MTTNQESRHAAVRALTGTARSYNEDWHALFDQWGIATGHFNERMLAWLNAVLGTDHANINDAATAFAVGQGVDSWHDVRALDIFDYYIDSVSGSDANDGLTMATAKQTLAGFDALGVKDNNGIRVGFARGSSWREQLQVNGGSNQVWGAYGSGARPLINAFDVPANASFSKTGGRTYVYEISISHPVGSVGIDWINCLEDTIPLVHVADVATCDTTPGSYHVASITTSPTTLYVHASDSSDVTANGKTYEHTRRDWCFRKIAVGSCGFHGLHCRGGFNGEGNLVLPATVASNLLLDFGGRHHMQIEDGVVRDSIFNDHYFGRQSGGTLVAFQDDASGKSARFENLTFRNDNSGRNMDDNIFCTAMFAHRGGGGDYARLDIINCDVERHTNGVSGDQIDEVNIIGCRFADNDLVPVNAQAATVSVYDTVIHVPPHNEPSRAINLRTGIAAQGGGQTMTVTDATICVADGGGDGNMSAITIGDNSSDGLTLNLTRVKASVDDAWVIKSRLAGGDVVTVNASNCTFGGTPLKNMSLAETAGEGPANWNGTNNHWLAPAADFELNQTVYADLAAFQAAGHETTGDSVGSVANVCAVGVDDPLLRQDFTAETLAMAKILGPDFTFTRASAGYRFNSHGVYVPESNDVPLLATHRDNGSSWVNDGLLMEPQRTNLLLRSEEFDNAAWSKNNVSVAANDAVAPDGTVSADRLTSDSTTSGTSQVVTITADADFVISYFVKRVDHDWVRLNAFNGANFINAWFDLGSGAKGSTSVGGTGSVIDYDIEEAGDYYRVWLAGSIGSGATSVTHQWFLADADASATESSGVSVHVWGGQIEEGATLSSYIPTTSAQVTRAAPNLETTDVSWYERDVGFTVLAKGIIPRFSDTAPTDLVFELHDGSFNNRVILYHDTSNWVVLVRSGAVNSVIQPIGSVVKGATYDIAVRYTPTDVQAAVNGTLDTPDTSVVMPSGITTLDIMRDNASNLSNMSMRELNIYRGGKSDAWLQDQTA